MTDWALCGAGWMAAVHGLAVRALGDRVVAVASRSRASAEALARETGGEPVAYDDLPRGADIVVVATPPAHHTRAALAAVAAGADVVVEKPLCTTLADADRLVRVAEAGGGLTYAENLLFSDAVGTALAQVAELGPLQHLSARALQARPTWGAFTEAAWGGGVFFDLGVHPLALVLRAAASPPTWVHAEYATSPDIEVEDWARVEIGFPGGLTATVEASWRATAPVWDLQAASATGAVRLTLLPELALERNGDRVAVPEPPAGDHPPQLDQFGYADQLRAAASQRATGSPTFSDVRFGRDVLEVVCAAAVSAATGERVGLPYTGSRDRTPVDLWRHGP